MSWTWATVDRTWARDDDGSMGRREVESDLAQALRRLLDAIDRGEITADTPAERRIVRRIEGAVVALEAKTPRRR